MTERSIEYMPLPELQEAENNPKAHDVQATITSIKAHGFVAPFIVNSNTGRMVVGHGRREALLAMQEAGEPAPIGIVNGGGVWLVPVMQVDLTPELAQSYLLADNRITELGGWDEEALASLLGELEGEGLLDATGFGSDDLEDLLAKVGAEGVLDLEGPFLGHTNEDADSREQREAISQERAGRSMREVVMLMEGEDHDEFIQMVQQLRTAYETDTIAETVREAVSRQVALL
jgi:ParB-like chromosome segregation protein Spo0J